jgi:hypothetical protein
MMDFICAHWEALSSLLLSVVAIAIAIYSSRKTAKDATRQIEGIKQLSQQTIENTTKEVESVKELAKLQIEALAIELDMEMKKYEVQAQRADEEVKALNEIKEKSHWSEIRAMNMRKYDEGKPERELNYQLMHIEALKGISKRLEQLKEDLK